MALMAHWLPRTDCPCSTEPEASETFVSHFYGRMPFVLDCGDLVAHRWTLEDDRRGLRDQRAFAS